METGAFTAPHRTAPHRTVLPRTALAITLHSNRTALIGVCRPHCTHWCVQVEVRLKESNEVRQKLTEQLTAAEVWMRVWWLCTDCWVLVKERAAAADAALLAGTADAEEGRII